MSLKALFLVLHFSHNTLMTYRIMLSIILVSILMIFLSTVSMIVVLICGKYYSWVLNLNLTNDALYKRAGSSILISMLEKLNLCHLTIHSTRILLIWKLTSLFSRKNDLLRCLDYFCFLNRIEALTLSLLLKLPSRKH